VVKVLVRRSLSFLHFYWLPGSLHLRRSFLLFAYLCKDGGEGQICVHLTHFRMRGVDQPVVLFCSANEWGDFARARVRMWGPAG
jgi:hypothetical protein